MSVEKISATCTATESGMLAASVAANNALLITPVAVITRACMPADALLSLAVNASPSTTMECVTSPF